MKTITFTFLALINLCSFSQNETVNLNYSYDVTAIYPEDSSVTQIVDIDQDGTNDLRINSWFGHNSGSFNVIEFVCANVNYLSGLVINQCDYLKECSEDNSSISTVSGYVYNTEVTSCVVLEGYKSFSFSFLGSDGIHQGAIYINYSGSVITIIGIGYNSTPNQSYFCETALSIQELNKSNSETFVYYNLLGQEVTEKKGILLQVSNTGNVSRKYFE